MPTLVAPGTIDILALLSFALVAFVGAAASLAFAPPAHCELSLSHFFSHGNCHAKLFKTEKLGVWSMIALLRDDLAAVQRLAQELVEELEVKQINN